MLQANDFSIRPCVPYYTTQGSGSPSLCARPDKAPLPWPEAAGAAFQGGSCCLLSLSPTPAALFLKIKKEVSMGLSPLSAKGVFEGMNKKSRKKEEAESSAGKGTEDKTNK